jgi:hypothetical protein
VCPKDTHLRKSECGTLADNEAGASEPVNRGIGVSVAVVERTTHSKLIAWDAATRSHAQFDSGATIVNYRIHRHSQAEIDDGADPYSMHFECNGREYWCALAVFQARTQAVSAAGAADAVAV